MNIFGKWVLHGNPCAWITVRQGINNSCTVVFSSIPESEHKYSLSRFKETMEQVFPDYRLDETSRVKEILKHYEV